LGTSGSDQTLMVLVVFEVVLVMNTHKPTAITALALPEKTWSGKLCSSIILSPVFRWKCHTCISRRVKN